MRIDTAIARLTLKNGYITIKGKGGKVREVPINEPAQEQLEKFLSLTNPGNKLFVPNGKQTHITKTELENFIRRHRKCVQSPDSECPVTFYGLRHTAASVWYSQLLSQGKSEYEARLQVSKWLGHERDDVTRIYLSGSLDV